VLDERLKVCSRSPDGMRRLVDAAIELLPPESTAQVLMRCDCRGLSRIARCADELWTYRPISVRRESIRVCVLIGRKRVGDAALALLPVSSQVLAIGMFESDLDTDLGLLAESSRSKDPLMRRYCAWSLGRCGGNAAGQLLTNLLDDELPHVRAEAVRAVAHRRSPFLLEKVNALRCDPYECVRVARIATLKQ